MVFIDKGVIESKIIGAGPVLRQLLKQDLSFKNIGHIIARARAKKRLGFIPKNLLWPGISYLINDDNVFPTGLLSRVLSILDANDTRYEILSSRTLPPLTPIALKTELALWSHQRDAIDVIKTHANGIIQIGTGGGKTKASIFACAEIGCKPFLFVVNRINLLNQTHESYTEYFREPIGYMGDGRVEVRDINVASIGTLCSILKIKYASDEKDDESLTYTREQIDAVKLLLAECKFVIIDECHHAAAATYTALTKALPNPFYKIGLSATPFRSDSEEDILLEAAFGQVIYAKSASELIRGGILCKPKIHFIEYQDPLSRIYPMKPKKGAKPILYNTVYKECVVENLTFNTIVCQTAMVNVKLGRITLISVKQIKHGQIIHDLMCKLYPDIRVEFLHGKNKMTLGEDRVKNDFVNGRIQILISTLLDEGIDLPQLEAVIDAGGGRSDIKALQLTGRAIRKYPGKNKAYIWMFIQSYRHLYKHSIARAKILQTEDEFDIQVLEWPNE